MTKQVQLLLPLDFIDQRYPNYDKAKLTFRKGKHWKPCTSELSRMKKALDKLSPDYEQAKALGMHVKAKRIFRKAMQVSKRISVLLQGQGDASY